ncbi:hypothetical protein G6F54_013868 [Rhizopus delemar]|nr:hypothetical protein G6F54_013868 [Rhizopus delemar]
MHLLTSISLATWPVCAPRASGEGVVVAERRMMSSDCSDMACLLHLLDLDQERLEFRCLGIAIAHARRQRVGQEAGFGQAHKTPVDGNTHVVHGLALDGQRAQALGDQRHGLDVAAVGRDLHARPVGDAQFLGQR